MWWDRKTVGGSKFPGHVGKEMVPAPIQPPGRDLGVGWGVSASGKMYSFGLFHVKLCFGPSDLNALVRDPKLLLCTSEMVERRGFF